MNDYSYFIWSSYGVTACIMLWMLVSAWKTLKKTHKYHATLRNSLDSSLRSESA